MEHETHEDLTALSLADLRHRARILRRLVSWWLVAASTDNMGDLCLLASRRAGHSAGSYMRYALTLSDVEGAILEKERDAAWTAGFLAGGLDAERAYDVGEGRSETDAYIAYLAEEGRGTRADRG